MVSRLQVFEVFHRMTKANDRATSTRTEQAIAVRRVFVVLRRGAVVLKTTQPPCRQLVRQHPSSVLGTSSVGPRRRLRVAYMLVYAHK